MDRRDSLEPAGGPVRLTEQPASRTRFYRDKRNGKLMGICAGIADYTGFDVSLVRICFLATVFMSGGSILPVYFIAGFIAPDRPFGQPREDAEDKKFWQACVPPPRGPRETSARASAISTAASPTSKVSSPARTALSRAKSTNCADRLNCFPEANRRDRWTSLQS